MLAGLALVVLTQMSDAPLVSAPLTMAPSDDSPWREELLVERARVSRETPGLFGPALLVSASGATIIASAVTTIAALLLTSRTSTCNSAFSAGCTPGDSLRLSPAMVAGVVLGAVGAFTFPMSLQYFRHVLAEHDAQLGALERIDASLNDGRD